LLISPLLKNFGQGFEYIQEYTGFISPGITAIFLFGFFWKKTTAKGATAAAVLSIPLSALLKFQWPDLPFLNRMGVVFWVCSLVLVVISLIESKGKDSETAFEVDKKWFNVTNEFKVGAVMLIGFFVLIYSIFW